MGQVRGVLSSKQRTGNIERSGRADDSFFLAELTIVWLLAFYPKEPDRDKVSAYSVRDWPTRTTACPTFAPTFASFGT